MLLSEKYGHDLEMLTKESFFSTINISAGKEVFDVPVQNYFDLVCRLRKDGCTAGYIDSVDVKFFPDIDELSSSWAEVCLEFLRSLKESYLESSTTEQNVDANNIVHRTLRSTYLCCQYGGIGAVYHWDLDSDEVESEGIFEVLTKPNGIMEMDEYVVDAIGLPFRSPEEQKLRKHLLANVDNLYGITSQSEDRQTQIIECLHALFLYGIQLGMVLLEM